MASEQASVLDNLALRIVMNGRRPVALADETERLVLRAFIGDTTLVESEDGVMFRDPDKLVQCATHHMLVSERDLLCGSNPLEAFARLDAVRSHEIGEGDSVAGRVLAEIHNDGTVDAFQFAHEAIASGADVFRVLELIEAAIPHLRDSSAESIIAFCASHYHRVKGDLAGGMIFEKLQPWLSRRSELAADIARVHEAAPTEAIAPLYACTSRALLDADFDGNFARMLQIARMQQSYLGGPALHALGLARYNQRPDALRAVVDACRSLASNENGSVLGAVATCFCNLIDWDEGSVIPALDELVTSRRPEVLYAVSQTLFFKSKQYQARPWFENLLFRFGAVPANARGILRNIDYVLSRNASRGDIARRFVESWLAQQPVNVLRDADLGDVFATTAEKLESNPIEWSRMLTEWLIHDDPRFAHAASNLLHRARTREQAIALAPDVLDRLDIDGLRFLLRRALGYLSGEDALIPLLFSLVRSDDAPRRTFGLVKQVFVQYIGYDYPEACLAYLDGASGADESDEVKVLAGEIAQAIRAQIGELRALPRRKEFHVPSDKARRFARERARQMSEAFEEASKDSVWRLVATRIPVKGGRRIFQWLDGRFTEPMQLNEHSHQIALPRTEISDPAGAARDRLLMRRATRGAK